MATFLKSCLVVSLTTDIVKSLHILAVILFITLTLILEVREVVVGFNFTVEPRKSEDVEEVVVEASIKGVLMCYLKLVVAVAATLEVPVSIMVATIRIARV